MSPVILILDADESVQTTLYKVLRSQGMDVDSVSHGQKISAVLTNRTYSLILLDMHLPGLDLFSFLKNLRTQGNQIPLLLASSTYTEHDVLYGLELGADDFVRKPFPPLLLAAKIKALIRRSQMGHKKPGELLIAGPFQYNTSTLRFYKNEQEILLSSRENAIMKLFLDNINRVFSKNMLYDLIWGTAIVDENVIMVYMNRLRRKIEDDPARPKYLQTVRGLGYRFVV